MRAIVFDAPVDGSPSRPRLTVPLKNLTENERRKFVVAEALYFDAVNSKMVAKLAGEKCAHCHDSKKGKAYVLLPGARGGRVRKEFHPCPFCSETVSTDVAKEGRAVLRAQELNLSIEHRSYAVMGPRWMVRWANARGADAEWQTGFTLSEAVATYEKATKR